MHRRAYLRSTGAAVGGVAIAAVGGCLGSGDGDEGDDSGTGGSDGDDGSGGDTTDAGGTDDGGEDRRETVDVDLAYPKFRASYYTIEGSPSDAPPAIEFADLSAESRLEVANAVTQPRYVTDVAAVLEDAAHTQPVGFRGESFSLSVAVADRFREPEHGPDGDPDWRDPVAIRATVGGGDLSIALENRLEQPLPVSHYGPPDFGALIAVDGTDAVPLEHEAYESNPTITTEGILRTGALRSIPDTVETLGEGESLTETYQLPADVPEDARVWLSAEIGGEEINLLGNGQTTVTAVLEP